MRIKKIFFLLMITATTSIGCSNRGSFTYTKIEQKNPTCLESGNDEYFVCNENGKYYRDSEGKEELETIPIIPARGHVETVSFLFDESFHWKERFCEHKEFEKEKHFFNGDVCSICGYSRVKPNTISMEYVEHLTKNSFSSPVVDVDYCETISTTNIIISKPGNYLIKETTLIDVAILANNVTLIIDNVSFEKPIECDGVEELTIILKNGSNNIARNNLISFNGILTIIGEGILSIDNDSEYPAIRCKDLIIQKSTLNINSRLDAIDAFSDKSFISLFGCVLNINTYGNGISSGLGIYINSSSVSISTMSMFVENNVENKAKYNLIEDDFIFKKEVDVYGKKVGVYHDYALLNSAKGIYVRGNKDIFLETPFYYNCYGILIEDSKLIIDSYDDCIFSQFGYSSVRNSSLILNSKSNTMRADTVVSFYNSSLFSIYCYEGIESAQIQLFGSNVNIKSCDDSIESSSRYGLEENIIIDNGIINAYSIYDDGIDAVNYVYVKGGELYLFGAINGEGFDCDKGAIIDDGVVRLFSNHTRTLFADISKQPIIEFNSYPALLPENTNYTLLCGDKILLTKSVNFPLGNVVYSSKDLIIGEEYTIKVGSDYSTTFILDKQVVRVDM